MERFFDAVFVLRRAAEPGWPLWKRGVFYLYRVLLLLCAAAGLGAVLLLCAYGPYMWGVFLGYFRIWQIAVLNILPVALLMLLCYGITGRTWAGFLLGGGVALGFSLGSYYKLHFRGDPLHFEDLLIVREAGAMTTGGRYELFVDKRVAAALGCLLLGTLLLLGLTRGRLESWRQRLALCLAALACAAALSPVYLDQELYDSIKNYECVTHWNPTEDYISRGFLYPFLHSISDFVETPPEGYSRGKGGAMLEGYQDEDIPEERKVNVIAIMREAYADFSRFGIKGLDVSGYDLYHALEAESYTGNLVTNIFAGGTIDTERSFLTGSQRVREYRIPTNSYVWYLRRQGYTTEGCHPYYSWFYNRVNVNANLGFERYRFLEGDFDRFSSATYPEDAVLLPEIYQDFQANKATGKPYFSFSVNVESHGPYATWDTGARKCLSEDYSLECRNAMDDYLTTIWNTDQQLADLMDRLRKDPEPVVLVTFGDHLPWMGDNKSFYEEMGVNLDLSTEEGFLNHFSTRYLIWANDAAKEVLGSSVQGEGPDISPCYLMNLVFRQLGWKGPAFTQAMDRLMDIFPVVSIKDRYVVDGRLVEEIPPERGDLFQGLLYLQQYWRDEFLFGEP